MARIAVLGWGSLIWDLDDLAPRVSGPWQMGGGPELPMEFARVSPKRRGALVVVLDPEHGTPCPTHAIASSARSVAEAAAHLAARERTAIERIGAVCLDGGHSQAAHAALSDTIGAWCAAEGWTGAVWTDLVPNFAEITGAPFGHAAAEAHLAALSGASRDEAVRYMTLAPASTATPLRRHMQAQAWWQAEQRRLAL